MKVPSYLLEYHIKFSTKFLYQVLTKHCADLVKEADIKVLGENFYRFTKGDYVCLKDTLPSFYAEILGENFTSLSNADKSFRKVCMTFTQNKEYLADISQHANVYYICFFAESLINTMRLMLDKGSDLKFDFDYIYYCCTYLVDSLKAKFSIVMFNSGEENMFNQLKSELGSCLNTGLKVNKAHLYESLVNLWVVMKKGLTRVIPYCSVRDFNEVLPIWWKCEEDLSVRDSSYYYPINNTVWLTEKMNSVFMFEDYIFISKYYIYRLEMIYEALSEMYVFPSVGSFSPKTGVFVSYDGSFEYEVQKISQMELKKRLLINKFDDLEERYGLHSE